MPVKIVVEEGFTLAEQLVRNFYMAWAEDWESEDTLILQTPYESYQGHPVEFCRDIFGVEFTSEIQEMLRSAQDNPVTLAKSANGVGKSFAAACFILYWFLVYPDAQVYTIAAPPEENLKLVLWGEIGDLIEKHKGLFAGFSYSLSSLRISRSPKSFVVGVAIPQAADKNQLKARFSGKHAPHLLFVADEGDGIDGAVYEAIETCMSGGVARLVVLFNPRYEAGPITEMEKDNRGYLIQIPAFSHPNVRTGKDLIPGAVDRNGLVRRINRWTEPIGPGEKPSGTDYFEVPAFLVGVVAYDETNRPFPPLPGGWRRVVESKFSYMVLAEYPAQAEKQLIASTWVDAAMSRWELRRERLGIRPPAGIRPYMSLDVAELGNDSNVATFYYGSWVAPQQIWRGVDVKVTGQKGTRLYNQNYALWANIDATGVGAGTYAEMKHAGCNAYRIMVGSNKDLKEQKKGKRDSVMADPDYDGFNSIRSQMLWDLREWLRTDPEAAIPNDPLLRAELIAPTYDKNIRAQIVVCDTDTIKEIVRRSPDRLMSLALRWAKQPNGGGTVTKTSYTYGTTVSKAPTIRRKAGLVMV